MVTRRLKFRGSVFAVPLVLAAVLVAPASAVETAVPSITYSLQNVWQRSQSLSVFCPWIPSAADLATIEIDLVDPYWGSSGVAAPEAVPTVSTTGTDMTIEANSTLGLFPTVTDISYHYTIINPNTGLEVECGRIFRYTHQNVVNITSFTGPTTSLAAGSVAEFSASLDAGFLAPSTASPNPRIALNGCEMSHSSGDGDGDGWMEFSDGTFIPATNEAWQLSSCGITVNSDSAVLIYPEFGPTLTMCGVDYPRASGVFAAAGTVCAFGNSSDMTTYYGSVYDEYTDYALTDPDRLYNTTAYSSTSTYLHTYTSTGASGRAFVDVDNVLTIDKTGSTEEVDGVDGTDVTYTYDVTSQGGDDVFDVTITDDKCAPVLPITTNWYAIAGVPTLSTDMTAGSFLGLVTNIGDTNHNGFMDTDDGTGTEETWRFTCTSSGLRTEVTNTAYAEAQTADTWCKSPYESVLGYATGNNWAANYGSSAGWDRYVDLDFLTSIGYATTGNSSYCTRGGVTTDPVLQIKSPIDRWTVRPMVGSLGNLFWHDVNGDGLQSDGEEGIGGVSLSLSNGTNEYTLETAADGSYLFENIPGGEYELCVDLATLPADYIMTTGNAGDDALDSDLPAGETCVTVTVPKSGADLTWDFGALLDPTTTTTSTSTTEAPTTTEPVATTEAPPTTDVPATTETTTTAPPATTETTTTEVEVLPASVSSSTTTSAKATTTSRVTAAVAGTRATPAARTGSGGMLTFVVVASGAVVLGAAFALTAKAKRRRQA